MIYFDKPTQERILRRFILANRGLLFAGHLREFQPDQPDVLPGQTVYGLTKRSGKISVM